MTPLSLIGMALAIAGSVLGVLGAYWVSDDSNKKIRHRGYGVWLINSPMIIISLVGIGLGWWEGLNALIFVPMNLIYWGTAARGWWNTR